MDIGVRWDLLLRLHSEGEVTAPVTRDGTRRGVSAQFDRPSEPERRRAARQFSRLAPRLETERRGGEERKADVTENQGPLAGK